MDRLKILIADDDTAVQFLLKNILSSSHELVFANDGRQALEKAVADTPDLIISDVRMPGLSGPEWIKRYEAHNPNAKVIFISGSDTVAGYHNMHKPFRITELKAKISEAYGAGNA